MKIAVKIIIYAFITLSVCSEVTAAEKYAFIKSKDLKQINDVITGFSESFPQAQISVLNLDGAKDVRKVRKFINTEKPSVLLCLGTLAAEAAVEAEKGIPIVFLMVINYKRYGFYHQKNVTGISMEIPSMSLFTQFRMILPQINSIAVPYHPEISSEIVDEAMKVSRKMKIHLEPLRITNPKRIKKYLKSKKNKIKGIWMLADTKLYNRKTKAIYDLMSFSKDAKKPVMAFSEAFLRIGAFFSISISYKSLGSQTALISRQIVQDKANPSDIPVAPPIGTYTVLNTKAAEQMFGDDLDETVFDEVDKLYPETEE